MVKCGWDLAPSLFGGVIDGRISCKAIVFRGNIIGPCMQADLLPSTPKSCRGFFPAPLIPHQGVTERPLRI
jgi:hypothetical protein